MYDLADLLREHRSTYYEYSSGELRPFWRPKLVQLLVAVTVAFFFHDISDSLLQALLAVYSILIGFSFSVLFHLISQPASTSTETSHHHETELRKERLVKLHQEIFYNVSFFVICSLIIVASVVAYYVLSGISVRFYAIGAPSEYVCSAFFTLRAVSVFVFTAVLYFLLLETGFAFTRIVQRVIFYFNQKIEHNL